MTCPQGGSRLFVIGHPYTSRHIWQQRSAVTSPKWPERSSRKYRVRFINFVGIIFNIHLITFYLYFVTAAIVFLANKVVLICQSHCCGNHAWSSFRYIRGSLHWHLNFLRMLKLSGCLDIYGHKFDLQVQLTVSYDSETTSDYFPCKENFSSWTTGFTFDRVLAVTIFLFWKSKSLSSIVQTTREVHSSTYIYLFAFATG